jgi:serine/threonine-protein kinase
MSPEQVLGRETSPRTDVYGLGATLYELLARAPVFEAREWDALREAVLTRRPPPLRARAPGIPAGLEALVHAALEKRPEDRPASVAAVRDELRRLAAQA